MDRLLVVSRFAFPNGLDTHRTLNVTHAACAVILPEDGSGVQETRVTRVS